MREPAGRGAGRRVAVALRYEAERDDAPRVVAKGQGLAAERLLEVARDAGVPLREDAVLAGLLATVDLDALVPPELYEALAAVLHWAYRQDRELSPSIRG